MGKLTKIPLALGVTASFLAIGLSFALAILAASLPNPVASFLSFLASWVGFYISPHAVSHHILGRALGVRFEHYFIGRSSLRKMQSRALSSLGRLLPTPGIKVASESLREVDPSKLAAMYRIGPIVSMVMPLLPTAYAFATASPVLGAILAVITAGNAGFTMYFSPRTGDFMKAKRRLRVI